MSSDGNARWRYGLWAVLGGAAAIVVVCGVAMFRYSDAGDVATAVVPAVAAIGTLAGAYFGIQAGSAGKETADESRDEAHAEALRFAAVADPDRALSVLGLPHGPAPDDGPDDGPGPAGAVGAEQVVHEWNLVEEVPAPVTEKVQAPSKTQAKQAGGETPSS